MAKYKIPKICEYCGSDDLLVSIADNLSVSCFCQDCHQIVGIAKQENLKKRTNSTLNHWALRRIKFTPYCYICGSKENLEAHHIIPVSNSREYAYQDTNGITLCQRHHWLVHNKEEQRKFDFDEFMRDKK